VLGSEPTANEALNVFWKRSEVDANDIRYLSVVEFILRGGFCMPRARTRSVSSSKTILSSSYGGSSVLWLNTKYKLSKSAPRTTLSRNLLQGAQVE